MNPTIARISARLRALPWRDLWRPALIVAAGLLFGLWRNIPVQASLQKLTSSNPAVPVALGDAYMGLTGAVLRDVRVGGATAITIPEIVVRPRISSLFFRPGVNFSADVGGGSVRGSYGIWIKRDLSLQLDAVDIGRAGLSEFLPMHLKLGGRLGGSVDLDFTSSRLSDVTGAVDLKLSDARLTTAGAFPLPLSEIVLNVVSLKVQATPGSIAVEPLVVDGDDVHGSVRGLLQMREPLGDTNADIKIRLHFSERLGSMVAPLLPLAGFISERDAWVRDYRGPLHNMGL